MHAAYGFLTKSEEIFSKSPGIPPPFHQEDMLIGLINGFKPSLLAPRRLEASIRTFRTFECLSYPSQQAQRHKSSSSFQDIIFRSAYKSRKDLDNILREPRNIPPNIQDETSQVFCSVCCKNTAHLALSERVGSQVAQVKGLWQQS